MKKGRTINRFLRRSAAALVVAVLAPISTALYSAGVFHDAAGYSGVAMETSAALGSLAAKVAAGGDDAIGADAARIDRLFDRLAQYTAAANPDTTDETTLLAASAVASVSRDWQRIRGGVTRDGAEAVATEASKAASLIARAGGAEAERLRDRLLFVTIISLSTVAAVSVLATVRITMPLEGLLRQLVSMRHDAGMGSAGRHATAEFAAATEAVATLMRSYHAMEEDRQEMMNSLPAAIFEVDDTARVRYFNTTGARLAASTGLGLDGLSFTDLLDDGSRPAFLELLRQTAEREQAASVNLDVGSEQTLVVVQSVWHNARHVSRWAVWCTPPAAPSGPQQA